jgi:hypothetical protein
MRYVCILLVFITVVAVLWFVLALSLVPFGAADGLYGGFREQLTAEVGREKADKLISNESFIIYRFVRQAILFVGLPLAITSTAWAIFGMVLVGRHSASAVSAQDSRHET